MRVLVVESEPELQRALSKSLQEVGCDVDAAEDGKEGLFKAVNQKYDALVIDAMVPAMDGWNVLSSLRKFKSTPVLMLITENTLNDQARSLDTASEDFLIKPFQMPELLTRLLALMRGTAGGLQPIIEIGDAMIDTLHRTVTRRGNRVSLTEIEYSLVELLLLHRRELVSRSMIYQKLYQEDDDSLCARVDGHISNIRKKLGYRFITTRKGQGYMIVD